MKNSSQSFQHKYRVIIDLTRLKFGQSGASPLLIRRIYFQSEGGFREVKHADLYLKTTGALLPVKGKRVTRRIEENKQKRQISVRCCRFTRH